MPVKLFKLIVLLSILYACTREDVSFYDNGQIKQKLVYKNNKLDGPQYWYYENGNLSNTYQYENGKLEGEAKSFFGNGVLQTLSHYKNGLKDGEEIEYNKNGKVLSTQHYSKGLKNGSYTALYITGEKRITGYFKDDNIDSLWMYYNKYGLLIGKGMFHNGNGELTSYRTNGNIWKITPYMNNKIHGKEIVYNNLGDIAKELNYKYGELVIEK